MAATQASEVDTPSDPLPPAGRAFPSTQWSRIMAAGSAVRDAAAWESLARSYWRPVYCYVRARWGRNEADALDQVQEFFAWMLESELLARADPERGRFRAFLKRCLQNFLTDRERRRRTLKRGSQHRIVALDTEGGVPAVAVPDPEGRTPEEVLDEVWRRQVIERALARVEQELAEAGKALYFTVFRDYFLSPADLDYRAVAARHGITTTDVSNYLMAAKRKYREALHLEVIETVRDVDSLREELRWLFGKESE